jgi:ketosteroid isomerase-like protein
MEIQDLQIAGDWAFEWAYFSYKENTAEGKVSTGQGKVLRVLHRQVDGSWKFARVMSRAIAAAKRSLDIFGAVRVKDASSTLAQGK